MNGASGSIFHPQSAEAHAIAHLFTITLIICAVIFAVVLGLVVYSLVRFRGREGEADPEQIAGNKKVEIVWTIIPMIIVGVLFALTVQAMQVSDPPLETKPDLVVIGHQWWWEIRYPNTGIVTANEIHIPVGKQLSIRLDTADVLHEFWVPQLTRKMTTVPLLGNHVWMEARKSGVYEGVCSEFCGTQHAWMRFQVVAEPQEQYDAWVRNQQRKAPETATVAAARRGWRLFNDMTCVNCHAIQGTPARGTAGPDLTHLASRRTLGSVIVPNTPENLRRWLADPQQVKPGVKMPNFKLTDEQVSDLVEYLGSLK
ncbi:cytochrome c oxidase subunit II [Opitutaceae bacterium EW11]|nr:cytochrome c oxidase subunit II [Opitutaceae bacterium EW11]